MVAWRGLLLFGDDISRGEGCIYAGPYPQSHPLAGGFDRTIALYSRAFNICRAHTPQATQLFGFRERRVHWRDTCPDFLLDI